MYQSKTVFDFNEMDYILTIKFRFAILETVKSPLEDAASSLPAMASIIDLCNLVLSALKYNENIL